jgi:hypothetical protein
MRGIGLPPRSAQANANFFGCPEYRVLGLKSWDLRRPPNAKEEPQLNGLPRLVAS